MQTRHQCAELIWLADLCGAETAGLVLCWLLGLGCCCRMELWWFESSCFLLIILFLTQSICEYFLRFWFPCTVFINGILVIAPAFDFKPQVWVKFKPKLQIPTMPSRESYVVKRGKKRSRRRAEKEAGRKGSLFNAALGLNVSAGSIPSLPVSGGGASDPLNRAPAAKPAKPASPASTFWQPIRSFALSQLTSLVRRATLRESDLAPKYEKVHNFKVSPPPSLHHPVRDARFADSAPIQIHFREQRAH